MAEALRATSPAPTSGMRAEKQLEICRTVSMLKKFLNMHGVGDPAPRILAKEITPVSLDCDLSLERIYTNVREKHAQ